MQNIIINTARNNIISLILDSYCFECKRLRIHHDLEEKERLLKLIDDGNSDGFFYNIEAIRMSKPNYCCDTKSMGVYFHKNKIIYEYIDTTYFKLDDSIEEQPILKKELSINEVKNIFDNLTDEEIKILDLSFDIKKIYDEENKENNENINELIDYHYFSYLTDNDEKIKIIIDYECLQKNNTADFMQKLKNINHKNIDMSLYVFTEEDIREETKEDIIKQYSDIFSENIVFHKNIDKPIIICFSHCDIYIDDKLDFFNNPERWHQRNRGMYFVSFCKESYIDIYTQTNYVQFDNWNSILDFILLLETLFKKKYSLE
jgi:hypothetical protein